MAICTGAQIAAGYATETNDEPCEAGPDGVQQQKLCVAEVVSAPGSFVHKIENAEDLVKVGDPIEVKILRVDTDDRKIGLSKKRVSWSQEREAAEGTAEV